MIRRIRRTPQARQDIAAIYAYIYSRNPAAADRVFDAIYETTRSLAQFPNVGNRWLSDRVELEGLRYTPVKKYRSYLIFFRVVGHVVEIYRVVHGARDLSQIVAGIER